MGRIESSKSWTFFGILQMAAGIVVLMSVTNCGMKVDSEAKDMPQKVEAQPLENQCNQLYTKNKRGKRLSWKNQVPVIFYFDPSVPKEMVTPIENAMAAWNQAAKFEVFRSQGYRKDVSLPRNDQINTIYFADAKHPALAAVAKTLYGEDGTIADTQVYYQGNKIADADIVFNGVDYTFSASRYHLDSYDITATAIHELGHALGFGHSSNFMSVMFYAELSFGFSLRQIDSTSQKILACEYGT